MRTIRGPCAKNFLSPKITNVSLRTPCMPGECQANKNKQSPTNNEIQARAIHAIPLPGGFQASTMRNFSVRDITDKRMITAEILALELTVSTLHLKTFM